jgi:hypothetical protein
MNPFDFDGLTSFVEHGPSSSSTVDYSSAFLDADVANSGGDMSYFSSSVSPLSSRALTPIVPAVLTLPSHPPAPSPMISMRGTMAVHNFDPKEGPSSAVLSVQLNFRSPFPEVDTSQFFLRICIDDVPLPTKMIQRGGSAWELRTSIREHGNGKQSLKLSVQACHSQEIIDVVEFGFYYISAYAQGQSHNPLLCLIILTSSIIQTQCTLGNELERMTKSRNKGSLRLPLMSSPH